MNIGGLGARAALLKHQKPTKLCSRCGLRYAEDLNVCSHCGTLSDQELYELKERLEFEGEGSSKLGLYLIMLSIISALLFLLALN